MARPRLRRLASAALVVAVLSLLPPPASAGGSDPVGSGSYNTVAWTLYFDDPENRVNFYARIHKLTSETDPTYDYISLANYAKQLSSSAYYDLPKLTLYMGQEYTTRPVELDWAPGFDNPGTTPVTYSAGISASGPSFEISWTHEWEGSWNIEGRGDATQEGSSWKYSYHTDRFDADGSAEQDDWNTYAHANVWKVRQGRPLAVYAHSGVATCSGGMDCWWFWPWTDTGQQEILTWNADCDGPVETEQLGAVDSGLCTSVAVSVAPEVALASLPGTRELTHKNDIDITASGATAPVPVDVALGNDPLAFAPDALLGLAPAA